MERTKKEAPAPCYPQIARFRADVQAGDVAEVIMPVDGIATRFMVRVEADTEMNPLEYVDEGDELHTAWKEGWVEYVGLVVEWEIPGLEMGNSHAESLWGIENWHDKSSAEYMAVTAHELIAEAAEGVAATLADVRCRLCMAA